MYSHSDHGTNLCSEVIQTLCKLPGMGHTKLTVYNPQGNGQGERFNRTFEAMLVKCVKENKATRKVASLKRLGKLPPSRDWDSCLPQETGTVASLKRLEQLPPSRRCNSCLPQETGTVASLKRLEQLLPQETGTVASLKRLGQLPPSRDWDSCLPQEAGTVAPSRN